ncbi:MAG: extracellular solute-binding protein [Clostridia bacterium]|nr:extracellular solute-binding protein [Clostridia bacterium]
MKFKKLKQAASIIGAAAILLSGCGNKDTAVETVQIDDNVTEAGQLPVVKEPITLKVGIQSSSKITDLNTNAFTKYLTEKTGINLEFYEFPASGGMEKLNVMLASDSELPDVICGFNISRTTFLEYADRNVFVDLTPYMEKYGYWIKDMSEKTKVKNFESFLTAENGKKYFMPNVVEQTGNMYGGKAFINKKWLDKLGLKVPETTEEFENAMIAFVTQDPNGNGQNDEIGFTGSKDGWLEKPSNFLMNSFIFDDYRDGFVVDDNKKISVNYTSDKYKNGLAYLSDLANKKALDLQCFTQSSSTLRSLCARDEEVIGAFASGSPDVLFSDNPERLQDFVALPPLKGPDGTAYAYKSEFTVACGGVITKHCKYPAAAFRLLDFMLSEEASLFGRYGVEGTDWKKADENAPALFESIGAESKILPILPYGSIQNSHWNQFNPSFRSIDMSDTVAWDGDPLNGEYFKAQALSAYIDKGPENTFTRDRMILNLDDMREFGDIYNSISTYVKETVSLFISGEKNLDKDWEEFQQSLKNLGIERYLELAQKGSDEFLSK